ncbi:M12 family metallopeptidase [Agromyces allii]|uniref:Peptidase M12A domain-containing protein n=1 Tax=Agromyces allii TaxID=393607 RepID=A0ABN2QXL9_9MICO|nr:M12 family metallopeptidase [Agromyces allii]
MAEKKPPAGGSRVRSTRTAKPPAPRHCEEADGPIGGTALIDGFGFTSKPVVWAEVDGLAIVEGDIIIGTADEARAVDVSRLTSDPEGVLRSVGISGAQFRWPNGRVPYEIASNLPNPSRVTNAIAHWQAKTPLQIVPRNGEADFVRFVDGGGCSSSVGRRGGQQNIVLGSGCGVGNTIHELGHAIGLWHEQSRQDRNSFVQIHFENIESGKESNFNQQINDGDDLGAYDFGSIMHYGPTAFSKNGQPTIVAIAPIPAGVTMGQRDSLSAGDIAGVKLMYPNLAWPKTVIKEHFKEVAKDPIIDAGVGGGKQLTKEHFKEVVKEPFKEIRKEPIKDPIIDVQKRPGDEVLTTLVEQLGGIRPGELVTNPALPFVLGRESGFVGRFQAAAAAQAGVADPVDPTEAAARRAVALAEAVTALDSVRATLAAVADDIAAEAGL